MRSLTIGLVNIDQSELTIAMMENLAGLPKDRWNPQLIVIDNGSARAEVDALRKWVERNQARFGDTVLVATGENLGASGGRNLILQRARGERILILDNDLLLPQDFGWLDALWQDLDDDDQLAIAGPMLVFATHPTVVQAVGIGLTKLGRVGYLYRGDAVDRVPSTPTRVVASPAACWLMNAAAQRKVGLFPQMYHPMQYWDVDYCMQLREAGFAILCDPRIRISHIGNVTTRAHGNREFARTAVRHGMIFRERWRHVLQEIDAIDDCDIYWGPIPRP